VHNQGHDPNIHYIDIEAIQSVYCVVEVVSVVSSAKIGKNSPCYPQKRYVYMYVHPGWTIYVESDPPRNGTSLRSELWTCKKYGQQIFSVIKQFKFNLAAVSVSKRSRDHGFSLQLVSALKRAQIMWEQTTFLSCLLCPVSCPIVCDVALSELFVDESKKTSQYLGVFHH
jgi:hypothetical protein